MVRDKASANHALAEFFSAAVELEPTDEELHAAAALETLAQRAGLDLDVGESQLAVMVALRNIGLLDTGDKRAIRGFHALTTESPTCAQLSSRVRCLEQLLLLAVDHEPHRFAAIARSICAEPFVDRAASICFSCTSRGVGHHQVRSALQSYIDALRRDAPSVLAA